MKSESKPRLICSTRALNLVMVQVSLFSLLSVFSSGYRVKKTHVTVGREFGMPFEVLESKRDRAT